MNYASFWKRFHAYGYDLVLVQLITLPLVLLVYPFPTLEQLAQMAPESNDWFTAFTNGAIVISAIYNILFIAGNWQATPGKRFCGIRVVNADGTRLTLAQSAIRHAVSGISTLLFGLGFLTVWFTREKTALHDMICQTRVVRAA